MKTFTFWKKFNFWKKLSLLLGLMLTISYTSWGQCNYTLEMIDSYGDGWNGNTIDVIVNSTVVLNDVTLSSGSSGTMTFAVNTGDNITTVWNGGGGYGYETSYNILDVTGTVVGSGAETSISTPIVANCPSCLGPTSVSASNIMGNSMDISWTTSASNSNIEYGPAGYTQGTGTVVYNASNPYTISGLSPLTNYDVYVQDSCGATDLSSWIGPYTFSTAVSAPYFEDFETFSTTYGFTSENGWLGVGPGANDIDIVSSLDMGSPYSGSRAVEMNDGAIDSQDTSILVSPPLAGLGNGDKQIKFQGMAEDHAQNELYIGVMTNPYNTATLTILDTITFSATDQWFEVIVSLANSSLIGSAQHIAFVHGPSTYEIGIDDFEYFTPAQNDLSAKAIISPAPVAIEMTNAMTVEMEIYNNGINTQSNYDVSYSIDGGAFVTETVTPSITAGATYAHTFTTTADLSATGNHTITAVVSNTGDTLNGNDTITTTITNEAMPFSDNFDNLIEPYMPVGWNVVNTTSGGYVDSDNYEVYSPPMALDMYNSSADAGEDLILTLPQYFGSLSNKRLNFAAFNEELAEELIIGVMTDPTDGTTFTPVDTANFTAADTWQEFSIDLFSYTGTGQYVAFKHNCSDSYTDIYLDDVSLVAVYNNDLGILAVDAPKTMIGQTAPSTVTVQVKNYGLVAQSNFSVSFSADSGATYTTENITSTLNPGDTMTYTFTGTADLTGGGDFEFIATTGLAADQQTSNDTLKPVISNYALPHMENFDNVTIPALPEGWSAITEYSAAYVETDDYRDVSAPNSLDMYNSGGSSGQDLFAVMPAFKGNYSNLALEFDVYTETDSDSLIIGVLSNPTDATTFTGVDTIIYPSDNTYYYDLKVFFFNYTGSGEYIAFKHTSTDSYEDMYFDNVELISIPNDDVGVIAIDQPASGIQLTNSMPVTVQVKNYGFNSQSNIPVKFTSDGGASFITGTVPGPIAFGDTATYTFTSVADLTTPGNLTLHAITDLAADQNNMNDTAMKMINNYSLPYTENFDNMPLDDLTYDGWSFINETSGYVEVDDYRSTSAPNAIRMYNSGSTGGENLMAVMPAYYGDFNGKWINMDVYTETDTDSLIVGVLTDPTDPATFTGVDTILFPEYNVWASFPAMLSNYSGSGNYIAFRHTSTDSYEDIHIDNVVLETAPAGPVFTANPDPVDMAKVRYNAPDTSLQIVTISNQGIGQINITGSSISGANASNFAIVDTNTYPKLLGTLESIDMQVKFFGSNLGTKTANLDITTNSTTHSVAMTGKVFDATIDSFPFVENMEHNGNLPLGWLTHSNDGDFEWLVNSGTTTSSSTGPDGDHTTGNGYYIYTEASSPADLGDTALFITPLIDFSSLSNPKMNFWYHMYGSDIDTLAIDIATGGSWNYYVDTIIGEQHSAESAPWEMQSVDLGLYSSADSIQFRVIRGDGYYGDVAIDDIAFGEDLNIDLGPDTAICADETITFDAGYQPTWTYQWYFNSMSNPVGNGQTLTANTTGKYYVVVTDAGYFTGMDSVNLTVNSLPVVNFPALPDVCENTMPFTLDMATPSGGTYSGTGVSGTMFDPDAAGFGTYMLYYTYTDGNGCTNIDSSQIVVKPIPSLTLNPLSDVCIDAAPFTLSFATPTGGTYYGPGVYSGMFYPDSAGAGTHYIKYTYTAANGCSNVDSVPVTVNPLPVISASAGANPVSYGTSTVLDVTVSGSSTYTYAWTPADSLANPTDANLKSPQTKNLTRPTQFDVVVTDAVSSCSSTDNISLGITGGPLSVTPISFRDTICKGDTTKLFAQASGGSENYTYSWSSTPAGFNSADANPVVTVDGTTTYTVTVNDGFNTTTGSVTVENYSTPVINLSSANGPNYLECAGADTLSATPAGGTFAGNGITGNIFSPASAGIGTHYIQYLYTDVHGCLTIDTLILTVIEDVTPPAVVTQDIDVYLNTSGTVSISASDIDNGTTDNCGVQSLSLNQNVFSCAYVGSNTVTLTAEDINGNSASGTATVTVYDTISPTVVTQNVTGYLNANGVVTVKPSDINNGSSDNCAIMMVTLSKTNYYCSNIGPNMVSLIVTDASGNSASGTAVVTILDTVSPNVITQDITAYLDASGQTSITVSDVDNGSTDNCGINNMSLDKTNFSCSDVGANTVTLTVTDIYGNTASTTATVTVADTTAPSVTTQNATVYLDASGNASINTGDIHVSSSDNCGVASIALSKSSFTCSDLGINNIILSVTDVNGNIASQQASVTVMDTITPVAAAQNHTVYLDNNGNASIVPADIDNGSSDNCSINLSLDISSFDCNDVGSPQTVTLTATDQAGNSHSATAQVTVMDTISPTVILQNITVYLDGSGQAIISASDVDNGTRDNCSLNTLSLDITTFNCSNIGANTVTLTANDVNGNTSSGTATVTVMDTIAPNVVTQNVTVYLDAAGQASITAAGIDNGSTDNCGIASMSLDQTAFDCNNLGSNTVTLTVTDVNGNQASATALVTVVDNIPPTVIAQNITVYLDASGQASIVPADVDNGSTDNCSLSLSVNPSTFNCANVGTPQSVTLTGTDGSGNTASASATVTVMDTISPTLMTNNPTVYLDATGQAAITLADIDNGSYDNCLIYNYTMSKTTFFCNDAGTNTITFTATDVNGNSSATTVQVMVLDTIKPQAIAQNVTVYLNSTGQASVAVFNIDNGSFDNCALNYVLSKSFFDCSDIGTNNVTLTVTDPGGNSDMASATVTVLDTITPQVNTQNISVYLDATGQAMITPADINNGSVINCPVNYSLSQSAFDCNDIGTNTVTLYATDVSGNTDSATAQVTVADTLSPVVNSQNVTVYLDAAGQATITASDINNGSFDNCGISNVNAGTTLFNCSNTGVNTVTLTVTDNSGNSATSNAQVMVMDTINPVAITQNITVYLDSTGNVSISNSDINNGSSDNCGIDTLHLDKYAFTCSDVGMNTVTLTVTDVNGNTATNTAQVNVIDNINPEAVAQSTTVYLNANGEAIITTADIDNGSWDNCQFTLTLSQDTFNCNDVGNNGVILTATDASGNTDAAGVNVNVVDSAAPVVMTQNISIYLNNNGQATINVADVDNGTTDNCGLNTTSISKSVFDCNDVGINTVTLTASDVYGNTSTGTAQVTVIDSTGPVIYVNNISLFLDSTGQASLTVNDVNNGTWDNCGLDSLYLSQYNFDCSQLGFNTVTMYATDVNGNTSTAPAVVNVYDTINPTAIAQNITVYLDALGNATIAASDINNGSYDNCGILFTSINKTSFNCSDAGTNMVTLTVTDNNLNTSMAMAQVTVVDNMAPVVIAQNATIYLDATGQATLSVNDVNNSTSDNCGIASIVLSQTSFTCNDIGINPVTLTATDINGNTTNVNVNITVVDNTAPVALSGSMTVYLDATGQASITSADIDNGSYDNCSISAMSLDVSSFNCADLGTNMVNLTVTDGSGNNSSTNAVVTVVDTTHPVVQTNNITVYLDASGQAVISESDIDNGSYDNCSISSMMLDITTFDCTDIGTNSVTLSATDTDGNTSTATATVTVVDNMDPVAMTNDFTTYLDATGQATISASDVDNGSMDNCGIDTMYLDMYSFTCSELGANTVILTAEDMSGNTTTTSATVTVEDTIKPTLQTNNLTLYLDASGQASIGISDIDNGSTDNCSLSYLNLDQYTFSCQDLGTNTIILSGTDQSGNTSQMNATVTVMDTIDPVVQANNITVYLDNYGYAMITPADVDNGSTDNCGIDNMSLDVFSFDCSDLGANTVTLTGSDISGNTVSTTATVTVIDNTAPMVLTKNSAVFLDASGNASITIADVDNGSWDNCSIANMTLDINTFNCYNLGPNNVTLTATDQSSNTATGNATISVIDTISPTVQTNNITIQLDASGQAVIAPFDIDNGTFDNCYINNMMIDINTFDCNDIGTNTVNLMAWDVSGNYASATAQVTVEDNTPPVISTIDIPVFLDNTGQAMISASDLDNGTYDNCMVDTMMLSKYNFTCSDLGPNLITFTALDANGNSSTSTAVVTVYDNIAPNATTQNITIYLDAFGLANITASDVDNGSSDNCGIMSMNLDNTVFTCNDVGTNTVTLTVTDVNLNSATATAQVTVMDTIAPNAVTQNYSVYLDNSGQANITANDVDNGSSDNCGIVSRSLDISSFTCSDIGNNLVVLTVSDQAGNTSSSTTIVNVIDTINPVIAQMNDTIVCAGVFNYSAPVASDNCNVTVNQTYGPASGDVLSGGSYSITFVAEDNSGNTASSTFNVTVSEPVVDLGPDTAICHNDTIELSASTGYTAYLWSTGETTSSIKVDSSSLGLGVHTFWVNITDSIGCTSSDTVIVEIRNCVGIEEFADHGNINIYPNPSKGVFNLDIKGLDEKELEICIYNFNGQKIVCERFKENFNDGFNTSYDLSTYPKGIYLIRLSGSHTQKVKRVIIQ